ncbi:AfsR/SARP family transcriptional regulator [Lutimaribacter saemankumensis]|uniref:AfsR/SARP family transcriptional regulator n=1 Tax=Lutimaribacter saemankumensis TaxID=490829 RepID=UPI000B7CEA45|nr:winged helix-turn-helix domain-containing protein [Lutimaribacter saemankumensis]
MTVKEMQNRENSDEFLYFFRLIGAFSVTDASGKSLGLSGCKDRAVLAFLAAHPGHPVARDRLVELVWPGSLEGAGRASLRQSLSTIRKALTNESILTVDRDTITLNAGPIRTDIAQLGSGPIDFRVGA